MSGSKTLNLNEKNYSEMIISRTGGKLLTHLENETIILDIETGEYFGLNDIGTRIWELIEEPSSIQSIFETLLAEYDIEKRVCEQQLLNFLQKLTDLKLVEARDNRNL